MMSFSEKLKQLDQYLLLNQPIVWETKVHYLAVYLVLSYAFVSLISLVVPVSLHETYPNMIVMELCIGIVSCIVATFWMCANAMYSVEEQYGVAPKNAEQTKLLIYVAGMALLGGQVLTPQYLVDKRIEQLVSHEEFIKDVNSLNEGNIYFPSEERYSRDNEDNIFACSKGESYNLHSFGNVVHAGRMRLERSSSPNNWVFKESAEQLKNKAMELDYAIPRIKAYMKVFEKYGGEEPAFKKGVDAIFQDFKNKKIDVGNRLYKPNIRRNIRNIQNHRFEMETRPWLNPRTITVLMIAFFVGFFLQVGKHIGVKAVVMLIVGNSGILLFGKILVEFLAVFVGTLMYTSMLNVVFAFTSVIALLFLMNVMRIPKLRLFSRFHEFMLASLQLYSPFVFLHWVVMISPDTIEPSHGVVLVGFGIVVYLIFCAPQFREMHLRLRALPRLE